MKKIIFVLLLALLLIVPVSADTWWDANFVWRQEYTVNSPNATSYLPIMVNITNQSGMQSDFDDIRFVNQAGTSLLPSWKCPSGVANGDYERVDGSYSRFWVNLTPGESTIYVYWGNASASDISNGKTVFPYGTDFFGAGAVDPTRWSYWVRGDGVLGSGYLQTSSSIETQLVTLNTVTPNSIVYSRMQTTDDSATSWAKTLVRYQNSTSFVSCIMINANSPNHGFNTVINDVEGSMWSTNYTWNIPASTDIIRFTQVNDTYYSDTSYGQSMPYGTNNVFSTGKVGFSVNNQWRIKYLFAYPFASSYPTITGGTITQATGSAFSMTPNPGTYNQIIQFNDTTVATNKYEWNWSFGDGTYFDTLDSGLANTTHSYSSPGNYSVTLTLSYFGNTTIVPQTQTLYIGPASTVDFSANQTTGASPLNVQFIDTSTALPTSWQWYFGDNTTNSTLQNPTHTFSLIGNYTITLTATNGYGTNTTQKVNYINVTGAQSTLPYGYTPHNVRFFFVSTQTGAKLSGLTITATPTGQTSSPTSWIEQVLGLNTNLNMPTTVLSGTTGQDGSINFLMAEVIQYNITISGTNITNQTLLVYPKDYDYQIGVKTANYQDFYTAPTYNLTYTNTTDNSNVTLGFNINDPSNQTTNITFSVTNGGTPVYSVPVTIVGGVGTASYTVLNSRGAIYTWGFTANSTFGTGNVISMYKDITLRGNGSLIPTYGLTETQRMWVAVMFIFAFAGIFGAKSVKFGVVLVPLVMGGFFWYVGWLPWQIGGVISVLSCLGVLMYMRAQERVTMGS